MADDPGTATPPEDEEKKKRRRAIAWWWWAVGGAAVLVVAFLLLNSGGGDDGDSGSGGGGDAQASSGSNGGSGSTSGNSGGDSDSTPTALATTDSGTSASGGGDADRPEIEGIWEFIVSVTETSGVCAGEEDEPPGIDNVTIRRLDDGTYEVTGLEGEGGVTWRGGWDGDEFVFGGERDEDGGVTVAEFTMQFRDGALVGTEDWSWSDSDGECPAGKSTVDAYFYAPLS